MLFWMFLIDALLGSILKLVWHQWLVLFLSTIICWLWHGTMMVRVSTDSINKIIDDGVKALKDLHKNGD